MELWEEKVESAFIEEKKILAHVLNVFLELGKKHAFKHLACRGGGGSK